MSRRRRGNRPGGGGRPAVHLGNVTTDSRDNVKVIRTGELIEIGDLSGEVRQPVTAAFVYFGQRIRVNPDLTELDVIDLLEQAQKVDMKDPASMTMTKDYARAHVHPADFDTFWGLVKEHRQDTEAIMVTCWRILDAITANPTGGQSDSSDGQPGTKTSSQPTSSGQVTDLTEHRQRRDAYLRQLQALESARGEDGQPIPVNAAIALQIVEHARTQGINLVAELPSAAATG